MAQENNLNPQDPKGPDQETELAMGETVDFSPPRKQEQLRTTIGRVVQNDPLAAKRFQDLVGRALSKRHDKDETA
jgi:hypothetical protein